LYTFFEGLSKFGADSLFVRAASVASWRLRAITLFKAVLLRMIEDIRLFAARQKYRWPLLCTGCWDDTR
jgi:hypothetical protein